MVAVFLASAVEFVEALHDRARDGPDARLARALAGTAAALVALAVVTAVAGYALVSGFRSRRSSWSIGSLLLIFGLQWLRKAILRSVGPQGAARRGGRRSARSASGRAWPATSALGLDWFAFVVSFKGVFLEGLEVVFIVITFGLNADTFPLAAAGAAVAGAVVLARARSCTAASRGSRRTR